LIVKQIVNNTSYTLEYGSGLALDMGPFINYVTLKAGGGGPFSVTLYDREGEGLLDA